MCENCGWKSVNGQPVRFRELLGKWMCDICNAKITRDKRKGVA